MDSPTVIQPRSPGSILADRYRILDKIGEGGMGEVYSAEHVHLEKKVAIKLLRPDVVANHEAVGRFRQEARSASAIGHENIIQIDDFGSLPDGRVYMAMEWLQGLPLSDLLSRGPLAPARALDILIQTGRGLAAAHAKGITHRDLKPENVFITSKDGHDVPKLLDFGIAKVNGGGTGTRMMTVAGQIFGTPFYMAPEQALGAEMDHRVDIYAMGVLLYEVFCGAVPFTGDSFMGILSQHIASPPPSPSAMAAKHGRQLPPGLEPVILRALHKEPRQRFQSMQELVAALIGISRGGSRPSSGNRRWLPVALAGLLVVAGVVAISALQPRPQPQPQPLPVPQPQPAPQPVPQPPPLPVPQGTAVQLTSLPDGADVFLGGQRLGKTPLTLRLAPGELKTLTLRMAKYEDTTVVVDGSEPLVSTMLNAKGLKPF